jgi:hypothetical protein
LPKEITVIGGVAGLVGFAAFIESDRTCGPSDPQLVYVDDDEPGTVSLREALG